MFEEKTKSLGFTLERTAPSHLLQLPLGQGLVFELRLFNVLQRSGLFWSGLSLFSL